MKSLIRRKKYSEFSMNFCLHFALLIGGGLAAVGHADPTVNEWVMLDMIQNNPVITHTSETIIVIMVLLFLLLSP